VGPVPTEITWNKLRYKVTGEAIEQVNEKLGESNGAQVRDIYRIKPSVEVAVAQLGDTYFKAIAISR